MATNAERRAARERVSAYHQAQLAELLSHVGAAIDRYRTGESDAYGVDETVWICWDAVSFHAEQNVLVLGSLRRALARVRSRCQLVLADGPNTASATV